MDANEDVRKVRVARPNGSERLKGKGTKIGPTYRITTGKHFG